MIQLRTLGAVELRRSDGREMHSVVVQPKRLALLAYLAVASPRGFHRRDTLLALFWPELDQEHARGALSKAVHYLRRALGEAALVSRGDDELAVSAETFWCDAPAFELALGKNITADAAELYRGDLLQGVFLPDAPEFERWLETERARLRERATEAAWSLAAASEVAGDAASSAHWARRAVALAPLNEPAVRRLLALLDRQGDRAGAVRAYEQFASVLIAEYDVTPSGETQALIETIRERDTPVRTTEPPTPPPSVTESRRDAPRMTVDDTEPPAARPTPWFADRRTTRFAAVAILVAFAALAAPAWFRRSSARLDPRRVAVTRFENRTGDSALAPIGSMAADWITQGLARTELVEVVPFTAVLTSSKYVGRSGGASGNENRARALAEETGAGTVVAGSYYRQGDSLHFQTEIVDASGRKMLLALEPVRAPIATPLDGIELLRRRVVGGLAPFLDERMRQSAALVSRPPSYDAYRQYAEGLELFVAGDMRGAIGYFRRAAEVDSSYRLPLLLAGIAYANLGEYAEVDSVARRVAPSRSTLAPLDRAGLDVITAWARGDLAASYESSRRAAVLAPGTFANAQLGAEAWFSNRPREAVNVLEALDPDRGELRGWLRYWENLTIAYHLLGDHERELEAVGRARTRHADSRGVTTFEVRALAGLGRVADIQRLIDESGKRPGDDAAVSDRLLLEAGSELRAHGHPAEASTLYERALADRRGEPVAARDSPRDRRAPARLLYQAGQWQAAYDALAALEVSDSAAVSYHCSLGTAGARVGQHQVAARSAAWLAAAGRPYLHGENTYCRAAIASILGERAEAVALLRVAFGEGKVIAQLLHTDVDFEPLRGYPPFEELKRPKG